MKKTNKGFSLVELIIVIAIMAILIGVLAPQYIKYVEKSRVSADEDNAENFLNAAMTACTDEDYIGGINSSSSIDWAGNNGNSTITVNGSGLESALTEYFSAYSNAKVKSKSYRGATYTVKILDGGDSALKASGSWHS